MGKNRPSDYDVEGWYRFYADHPNYHRSVGADGEGEGDDGGGGDSGGEGEGDGDAGGGSGDENWRAPFVAGLEGDDLKKEQTRLERFTQPADFYKSFRELEKRVTSGELLKPLPADATEDDVKAYREKMGIPLEAKGYLDEGVLPEGLVIGEDDRPIFESFAEAMHEANLTPDQMGKAFAWYNGFLEDADADQHENDEKLRQETEDLFRDEWGSDYRTNTNIINAFLEGQFGKSAELVQHARLADGTPLMSDPGVLRGLVAAARELNPAGVIVESGGDPMQSVTDEITRLEKLMRDPQSDYWKGPSAESNQARLRELYDVKLKQQERGKAA